MTPQELETSLALIVEQQKDNGEKLDKLCVIMTGNGDPSRGLILRFDRIEQWWLSYTKKKNRLAITLAGCILSFVCNIVLISIQFWNSN